LIEIINKQLLLQLVGYLCYWQMGFNSVFKGLIYVLLCVTALQKLLLLVIVICQLHERDFHMKSFVIVCEILWQSCTRTFL